MSFSGYRVGWQCPRCHTCYSPETTTCKCSTFTVKPSPILPSPITPCIPNAVPLPYTPNPLSPYMLGKATAEGVLMNNGPQLLAEASDATLIKN